MTTLCLGEARIDLVADGPAHDLASVAALVPRVGGAVAEVARAAAGCGARVAIAGGAGDDAWGAWLRDRLAADGVDLDHFRLVQACPTAVDVLLPTPPNGARVVRGERVAGTLTAIGALLGDAVAAADALVLDSAALLDPAERERALAARDQARSAGRPVLVVPAVEAERWPSPTRATDAVRDIARDAFLLVCDAEEARGLTGERDPEAALRGLLAGGARHAVLVAPDGSLRLLGPGLRAATGPTGTAGSPTTVLGVLVARLQASGWYPPTIAAALPEAAAARP